MNKAKSDARARLGRTLLPPSCRSDMTKALRFSHHLLIALAAVLVLFGIASSYFRGRQTSSASISANSALEPFPVVVPWQSPGLTQLPFGRGDPFAGLPTGAAPISTWPRQASPVIFPSPRSDPGIEAAERINAQQMRRTREVWERAYRLWQQGK